jgi:hypothetical protein
MAGDNYAEPWTGDYANVLGALNWRRLFGQED